MKFHSEICFERKLFFWATELINCEIVVNWNSIFSDILLIDLPVPVADMWKESTLEVVYFIFENRY
jgi:hypothetical protein